MTPRCAVKVAQGVCIAGGVGRRGIVGLRWGLRRGGIGGWDWRRERGRGMVDDQGAIESWGKGERDELYVSINNRDHVSTSTNRWNHCKIFRMHATNNCI